jgi:hypothetical protein
MIVSRTRILARLPEPRNGAKLLKNGASGTRTGEAARCRRAFMADLIETHDLTAPSQNGWAVDYRIRRDDGEELHAEVRCWEKARKSAEQAGNAEALSAIADRGLAEALEYAENVQSPAGRGAVLISIWFDAADNGNLCRRVSYERSV